MSLGHTRKAMVNNVDPEIRYNGPGWSFFGRQPWEVERPFGNQTLYGTKNPGGLSYTFHGTWVTIQGTTNLVNLAGDVFDPSWECFIDGVSIGSNAPSMLSQNSSALCESPDLEGGLHEIDLYIYMASAVLWFDNILYTPSPTSHDIPLLLVEGSDQEILYDAHSWTFLDNSSALTRSTGATVNFNFTGTGISWVSWIPGHGPYSESKAIYTINGGPSVHFDVREWALTSSLRSPYQQILFSVENLPKATYLLTVTHQGSDNQIPLTLESFYIYNVPIPFAPPSFSSKGQPPIGVILGGVGGSLTFGVLLLTLLWRWKHTNLWKSKA
ncbi:hypothetical protein BDZ94DRAFT_1325242 [Collybia nuda]|uniref:Uncharacterized protein n=1 Tax=Collybia nuda TaxID=64659 RepID=A0A9P5XW45_9AGAR|nr:hypothetical protein BDZ94DRAFT_1325242 [Collybia nuda]